MSANVSTLSYGLHPTRRALVVANEQVANDLASALPGGEIAAGAPGPFTAVVIGRGRATDVSIDILRRVSLALLLDPENADLARVQRALGGRSEAQLVTIPDLETIAAAEHTMLLMLALSRHLFQAYSAVVSGERRPGVSSRLTDEASSAPNWAGIDWPRVLYGKTLGIVGLGRVGMAVAARAAAFDMQVIYNDVQRNARAELQYGAMPRRFDLVLREADIVSLHVPLQPETLRMIDAPELALMRPTALLINTAHGRLTDEGALIKALRGRHIAGAGLDVFAYEALPTDSPLLALDSVVLTPHVAGVSPEQAHEYLVSRVASALLSHPD